MFKMIKILITILFFGISIITLVISYSNSPAFNQLQDHHNISNINSSTPPTDSDFKNSPSSSGINNSDVQKWTDSRGIVHYTDKNHSPGNGRSESVKIQPITEIPSKNINLETNIEAVKNNKNN